MTVYILGLDGASPELLEKYIEDGDLPNFDELRSEASNARLETIFPPVTPAAWTSFFTGKNPGKHGIFDFSVLNDQNEFEVATLDTVDTDTIYDILDRHGMKIGSFGVPMTYPPRDVDGYMISGIPVPELNRSTVTPEKLWDDIEEMGGMNLYPKEFTGENQEEYVESHLEQIHQFRDVFFSILDDHELDFSISVFQNTDSMAHWMWKYIDENHPDHEPGYEDCLRKVYMEMDQILEGIRSRMDEDDFLIVMSDHGHGRVKKNLYLNNLLAEEGLLKFERTPGTYFRRALFRMGITLDLAHHLIQRLGLKGVVRSAAMKNEEDGKSLLTRLKDLIFLSDRDVDWDRTRAYVKGNFGQVFLNQNLDEDEREQTIDEVKQLFYSVEDPETGEQIIEEIRTKEEMYDGDNLDSAPDLLFLSKNLEYMPGRHFEFGSRKIVKSSPLRTGHHKMEGIFFVEGPGIKQGEKIETRSIMDVAPTVLHMLGIPVPEDMDGEPVEEAYEEEQNVKYSESLGIDY